MNPKKTIKTSHLLIDNVPSEIVSLYDDAHKLGEHLFRKFASWVGRPVDPSDNITEHADLYRALGNAIIPFKGDTENDVSFGDKPEGCSSLLFNDGVDGLNKDNTKQKQYKAMKAALADLTWEQFHDELASTTKLDPPMEVWERYFKAGDLEGMGNYVRNSQNRPGMVAGLRLRELGLLKIDLDSLGIGHRKGDFKFLRSVIAIVASRLKTWRTWDHKSKLAKDEAEEALQNALGKIDKPTYGRFCLFAEEMYGKGYGIGKKLIKAVECKDRKKQFQPVMKHLEKYPEIREDFTELARVYMLEQDAKQLKGYARMTVCNIDTSPMPVIFGNSSRGYSFSLGVDGQRIVPTIHFPVGRGKTKDVVLGCRASKYFHDPIIEPCDGGYTVTFWRGKTEITGTIKEPRLIRKGGKFYFSLCVNVELPEIPKEITDSVFSYLSVDKKYSPVPFKLMTVDLGLVPLAAWSIVDTGKPGDCPTFNGSAKFVAHGKIGGIANRPLYHGLRDINSACWAITRYIGISKKLRDKKPLTDWDKDTLPEIVSIFYEPKFRELAAIQRESELAVERGEEPVVTLTVEETAALHRHAESAVAKLQDDDTRKDMIGQVVGEIVKRFNRLAWELQRRDFPEQRAKQGSEWEAISADAAQMLSALKKIRSLKACWQRYTWKNGDTDETMTGQGKGMKADFLKNDIQHYNGLRRDLVGKLVSCVVKIAKAYRVQVVVVEDFNTAKFDDEIKDRKQNSLWSLFAPGTVIDKLAAALLDAGIFLAKVDPCYTSQEPALSHGKGLRLKEDKHFLYYRNDNGLVKIDADINAAMGLARRFLTRHAVLSDLRCLPCDGGYLIPVSDDEDKGKRLKAFLKREVNSQYARLVPARIGNSYVLEALTKSAHKKLADSIGSKVKKERLYNHTNGHCRWLSGEGHFAFKASMKNEVEAIGRNRIPNVTPASG